METATPLTPFLSPSAFWQPLPDDAFDREAAAHLLRRAGWAAHPRAIQQAISEGLTRTLTRLFPGSPLPAETVPLVEEFAREWPALAEKVKTAEGHAKRDLQRTLRERSDAAVRQMSLQWLDSARQPEHAAQEKWHLFLADVYVVGQKKVRNAVLLQRYEATLREHAWGMAPELAKAVSRSPAMVRYLDLQESKKDAPNENFARELFELFVLGQGNYTEADIKEAARAFAGYRQREGEFAFVRRQADTGLKTVFGRKGAWTGDEVIDLAFDQPAAATFLPAEMVRTYLSHRPLPAGHLEVLGQQWRQDRFSLLALVRRFFGSQGFFAPEFRGNYIKSPVQFYLGMLTDLDLEVLPLARPVLGGLRLMGQELWEPPNVRGWVGGPQWINSSTLAARLRVAQSLFQPLNEPQMNADDVRELERARQRGRHAFRFEAAAGIEPKDLASRLLCPAAWAAYAPLLQAAFEGDHAGDPGLPRLTLSLLQTPGYQLC